MPVRRSPVEVLQDRDLIGGGLGDARFLPLGPLVDPGGQRTDRLHRPGQHEGLVPGGIEDLADLPGHDPLAPIGPHTDDSDPHASPHLRADGTGRAHRAGLRRPVPWCRSLIDFDTKRDCVISADQPLYVFIHLPKTGGTTFTGHLHQHLTPRSCSSSGPVPTSARDEAGHPPPVGVATRAARPASG